MDRMLVRGGKRLVGEVKISGSKNATLPIMAACLLSDSPTTLRNVPNLRDIITMTEMLEEVGATTKFNRHTLHIDPTGFSGHTAPYDIVRKMRASIYVLGPMLARLGKAQVSIPGGCAIGARPIDLHLKGFKSLGVNISLRHGYINAKVKNLRGSEFSIMGTSGSSVGATCNTIMAAVLAKGTTVIRGAAIEPEVEALVKFLNKMGAKIKGAGTPNIEIQGVKKLKGVDFSIIPDRIETGTFMTAAAVTKGDVHITNCEPRHITAIIDKMSEIGIPMSVSNKSIWIKPAKNFYPTTIQTLPYPGFPTDMQAQLMALLSVADGTSTITETVYQERFMHASELNRMGARINVTDASATIQGVKKLSGAPIMASDLRASAALIIAALVAEGDSELLRVYHIDRGYERIEQKLCSLGAEIRRFQP